MPGDCSLISDFVKLKESERRSLADSNAIRRAAIVFDWISMATAIINTIETLKKVGGLQGKDLANIVGVSPATVSRWASGTATPSIRTQTIIASLRYIVDRLAEFYTPDETRLWLNARHALLNNERAIDLINADQAQAVLAVIERMNDGVYL